MYRIFQLRALRSAQMLGCDDDDLLVTLSEIEKQNALLTRERLRFGRCGLWHASLASSLQSIHKFDLFINVLQRVLQICYNL